MRILAKIPYKNISPETIELLDKASYAGSMVELVLDSYAEVVLLVVR